MYRKGYYFILLKYTIIIFLSFKESVQNDYEEFHAAAFLYT